MQLFAAAVPVGLPGNRAGGGASGSAARCAVASSA